MNGLKFPLAAIDEEAHHDVHSEAGADIVLEDLYCNWVHLTYDWGFPPEVEEEDWESFERAAVIYHRRGSQVFAYIQASNCVRQGSYRDREWYGKDAQGRPVPYFVYPERFMVCLDDPEWRDHLRVMVRGAIERGADGIFFDNIFQGAQALPALRTWMGSTGCYCERCQARYLAEYGRGLPADVQPTDPAFQQYLRWRAGQVTDLVSSLARYARELQPGTPISANDYDPIVRNAYLIHGIDLSSLADVQDIVMIENYGLPRWEPGATPRLTNNALTIRTARSHIGDRAHLSVLSYDLAIGFDGVYPARRYLQGIAEAAACGASMTTKGSEYNDGGKMTLLTAADYADFHPRIGGYHRWLEANAGLFRFSRNNAAKVGLLHPGDAFWFEWYRIASPYFGAGQALTHAGIPWRAVSEGEALGTIEVLLVFDDDQMQSELRDRVSRVVVVPRLPGWNPPRPSLVDRRPLLRRAIGRGLKVGLDTYTKMPRVRRLIDRAGVAKSLIRSAVYQLPDHEMCRALLDQLPAGCCPRVLGDEPILMETWESGCELQIHLVNYGARPQNAHVRLPQRMIGHAISPDRDGPLDVDGARVTVELDVYEVLLLRSPVSQPA